MTKNTNQNYRRKCIESSRRDRAKSHQNDRDAK